MRTTRQGDRPRRTFFAATTIVAAGVCLCAAAVTAAGETPVSAAYRDFWDAPAAQTEIAQNLYRLWFSYPAVMGITWWNVADGGAAPGEPSYSGLYDREINPKPVYHALDSLINHAWKTRLTLKAEAGKPLTFRGFKGRYRVGWTDAGGTAKSAEFELAKDGDGL